MVQLSEEQAAHLEQAIVRAVTELFMSDIGPDTPMNEARVCAETAGCIAGRALSAALHEGEVDSSILFAIRSGESEMRDRFLRNTTKLFGPGGQIREKLSQQKTDHQDD